MVDVMMNLVCDNVVLSVTADGKYNHVLVDETFRNINTDNCVESDNERAGPYSALFLH